MGVHALQRRLIEEARSHVHRGPWLIPGPFLFLDFAHFGAVVEAGRPAGAPRHGGLRGSLAAALSDPGWRRNRTLPDGTPRSRRRSRLFPSHRVPEHPDQRVQPRVHGHRAVRGGARDREPAGRCAVLGQVEHEQRRRSLAPGAVDPTARVLSGTRTGVWLDQARPERGRVAWRHRLVRSARGIPGARGWHRGRDPAGRPPG